MDFSIQGYTLYLCNHDNRTGKGIAIYIASKLIVIDSIFHESFEEAISVKLRLRKGDALIICVIYRNPSSTDLNNENLITLLDKVSKDR